MAAISSKEIKNRIRSMNATRKITKAMELVAAARLGRAQAQALTARPYFEILRDTIDEIAAGSPDVSSPYLTSRPVKRTLYIVIAGDRGLAGGYNSNILKPVLSDIEGKDAVVLPIGKKSVEFFRSRKIPILTDSHEEAADISIGDCFSLSQQLSRAFSDGEFDEIRIAYTGFVSALSQIPAIAQLLPLVPGKAKKDGVRGDFLYEPDCAGVFDAIIPEYLGGVLYGALCESRASEQAARRAAMESATGNAEEMIAELRQTFNRARQAAITQEITEIVAGS